MNQAQRRAFDRFAPYLVLAIAAIAVWALVSTYANGRADSARQDAGIRENTANAITNCENANESRAASRSLWATVLGYVKVGADPASAAAIDALETWIVQDVYQDHDCNDLNRKYVLPPPPTLRPAPGS